MEEIMTKTITAIYENGALHPLMPLDLPEHQRVQLQIIPEKKPTTVENLLQFLESSGLVISPKASTSEVALSEDARRTLSIRLGNALSKPLSMFIIEDRGE